jgi:hypothetical protein
MTALFEDIALFYATSFDDAHEWPWPPAPHASSAGLDNNVCGILHLIDSTFTYGCAVANYSGCRISSELNADIHRGPCGSDVGMDDVMRFLQKHQNGYVLVNDRCSQAQSLQSSIDSRQQLLAWGFVDTPPPCVAEIQGTQKHFTPVVTLLTDYLVSQAEDVRRLYPAEILCAWLVEPRSICASCYQHVADHAHLFDVILSHDIEYLSDIKQRHPNGSSAAAFVPFASSLLAPVTASVHQPPLIGLHEKIKSLLVSCFVSNKRMLIGHVLRHGVFNHPDLRRLIHFFGQVAGREIEQKTDALAPYMFHVVIENSRARSYYSEKIIDCFLTGTIPLYWGSDLPSAFNSLGVITWNTLDDLVDIVSSLSPDAYWSRHSAVVDNHNTALSGPYTNTLQLAWRSYLMPLALIRAKNLENRLTEATRSFEIESKKRSQESDSFVSYAADAVRVAFDNTGEVGPSSVYFWIVVYVDATMSIARLERCLTQLQTQTLTSWHAIVIIDPSAYILPDYRTVLESKFSDKRIKVWLPSSARCKTKQDCILLALNASSLAYDESIDPVCFFLQGRDSLSSSESLAHIAMLYLRLNCWVTYGSSVLLPSMILEASRDAAVEDYFFPASVYERNTARMNEWLKCRPPFFTLLRSVMLKVPASYVRLSNEDWDPSLSLLVAAVELAGDRVIPSIRVVHERWSTRNFQDAAAGGSELLHTQAARLQREMIKQLPPLRRLRGARIIPVLSLSPNVSIIIHGGPRQPAGTTEVSVSVTASGIWIPEEATLRFLVDGEPIAGISELHSFSFVLPTVYGNIWELQAQLISVANGRVVLAEETINLELFDNL